MFQSLYFPEPTVSYLTSLCIHPHFENDLKIPANLFSDYVEAYRVWEIYC